MKSLIITKVIALIGIICLISMLSSCSGCNGNKWRKKRYVQVEVPTDTIPQFVCINNQILILK